MKPRWKNRTFIVASIFAVLMATHNLLFAFGFATIVDSAISNDARQIVFYLILVLVGSSILYFVKLGGRYFNLRYVKGCIVESKNRLYNNTLKGFGINKELDISMYTTNTDIIIVNQYEQHANMVLLVATFAFSCIGLLLFDWMLFVAAIIMSLLPMVVPKMFRKLIAKKINDYSIESNSYINFVQDSSTGLYDIKSFFAQRFFGKKHEYLNEKAENARVSYKMMEGIMGRTSELIGTIPFYGVTAFGGILVVYERISFPIFFAGIQLLNGIVGPVTAFFTARGHVLSSKELANRYFDEPSVENGSIVPSFCTDITFENVDFSYSQNDDGIVLKKFSIKFEKGKSYAIVGESGCGKSTMAKLVAGLLEPSNGHVLYDGKNIQEFDKAEYCVKVRYIDQAAHLFDFDIMENVELGNSNGNTNELINHLNLNNLDIKSEANLLSGGQKQRIIVARALNMLPNVLILDEPTASLDIDTAISVIRYIKSFSGLTLIVVTHSDNVEMLDLFDNIVQM